MLDRSGATRTDWSELGDTERPGEAGDCRKALEIGSPPSNIPLGHGESRGDSGDFTEHPPWIIPALWPLGYSHRAER